MRQDAGSSPALSQRQSSWFGTARKGKRMKALDLKGNRPERSGAGEQPHSEERAMPGAGTW